MLILLFSQPILLANFSLLLGPYFAQNFASKFGQGLVVIDTSRCEFVTCSSACFQVHIHVQLSHNKLVPFKMVSLQES